MTSLLVDEAAVAAAPDAADAGHRRLAVGAQAVAALLLVAALLRPLAAPHLGAGALANASTVFVAVVIQAVPFLVLGVLLSGAVAAWATPAVIARVLPRRTTLAVPVAGIAGMALPGCECGAIPLAGRLADRGAPPAAALAFLLAAPAVNPVVLVATAVAFPHRPGFVVARFVASLATAIVTALLWSRLSGDEPLRRVVDRHGHDGRRGLPVLLETAQHDLLHAGGFLVVGAAGAALLQTLVPRQLLATLGGSAWLAVPAMAVLAIVLAICSQADAFVATGFTTFSPTARLVFLVVGPAVDVKLMTLQSATFGRAFMARFAPLTLAVAVLCAMLAGAVVL